MIKRSAARVLAFQALYQLDVQGADYLGELDGFLRADAPDDRTTDYARQLVMGAWERRDQIDKLLEGAAQHWELHRLAAVDRSILRMAIFELCFLRQVPHKVVIDEAIELAKRFSTRQSPAFINGVLDAILKQKT